MKKRRWRYIVVHNSGTRQGSAKAFEYYHLHVRKMPNGLAYHFVIGNGTFHLPRLPEIEGRERFRGAAFHAAAWQHGVSLEGKRVAVTRGTT